MLQAQETQLTNTLSVNADDLKALLNQEQEHYQQLSRIARGGSTTDTVLGGIAGAGIGILGSVGLISGMVPGFESLEVFGSTLPVLFGAFGAGLGVVAGSFIDLHAIANIWRR
ncbi:MAG: hypothetical protein HC837_11060 [Chloroflexaceae bacterium]|nr:hypothetical protein [Chloroflexaceae bacterium]